MKTTFTKTVGKYGRVKFHQPDSCWIASGSKNGLLFIFDTIRPGVVNVSEMDEKRGNITFTKLIDSVVLNSKRNASKAKL